MRHLLVDRPMEILLSYTPSTHPTERKAEREREPLDLTCRAPSQSWSLVHQISVSMAISKRPSPGCRLVLYGPYQGLPVVATNVDPKQHGIHLETAQKKHNRNAYVATHKFGTCSETKHNSSNVPMSTVNNTEQCLRRHTMPTNTLSQRCANAYQWAGIPQHSTKEARKDQDNMTNMGHNKI